MCNDYSRMLKLANEHGFTSFTSLQDIAFRTEGICDPNKDLFIIGETSSGKTLIPLLIYQNSVKEALTRGEPCPKMLFVVPYRALAAQKLEEFRSFFEKENLQIVQSTGEFRGDDESVRTASVNVAIVISEKVFRYEAQDSGFLSTYDFLVLDEIGLINDAQRGVRLDFILAWAHTQKKAKDRPRVIALGTPFFGWDEYIKTYGYIKIISENRPIQLWKTTICYGKSFISDVTSESTDDMPPLHKTKLVRKAQYEKWKETYGMAASHCEDGLCSYDDPCRADSGLTCEKINGPCKYPAIVLDNQLSGGFLYSIFTICRYHLQKNHQILIFINDRERVKKLCADLFTNLAEFFHTVDCPDDPRAELLKSCGLEYDDVYGVLEDEASAEQYGAAFFYKAFLSGIGFHSAALPNELRTYVEKNFLSDRKMNIVCSTETLAFGVNSAVDVVIIADLQKNVDGVVKQLTLNEYNNYAGRAGRLQIGASEQQSKGYVYTLVRDNQKAIWQSFQKKSDSPQILYSHFHSGRDGDMPFFLLSILPTTATDAVSLQNLFETIKLFPRGDSPEEEDENAVKENTLDSLRFLIDNDLAETVTGRAFALTRSASGAADTVYCLTDLGKKLRGYVICRDDFIALKKAIEDIVIGVNLDPDLTKFIFRMLCTNHAESGLNSIFNKSETRMTTEMLRTYLATNYYKGFSYSAEWLENIQDIKKLSVLAAIVAWSEGESPRAIYRNFGVHYALLSKLTEQISYLIEVAREIIPYRMESIWKEKKSQALLKRFMDVDTYVASLQEKDQIMHNLFISVYYGVNTGIAAKLLDFIESANTPESEKAAEFLSLSHIGPESARVLRKVCIRYHFFHNPPEHSVDNIEEENNFRYQFQFYKEDVKSLSRRSEIVNSFIYGFFKQSFPAVFD